MNTKDKGNIGIGAAIAYFTSVGRTVSIPLTDSQDYDLVIDYDGVLSKVQVKYTNQKAPSGNYQVGLRSVSGSSRKVYKDLKDSQVDLLFVCTGDFNILIPVDVITVSQLTITEDIKKKYAV